MIRFRIDDFPSSDPQKHPQFNLESFKEFDAIMEKHDIYYLLGCIPRYTTDKDLEWFLQNGRIEVALHGINHDEKFRNEFRDHETENEIMERLNFWRGLWNSKIKNGLQYYIPPHNVIDHKTVRALIKSGFEMCFGGPETEQEVVNYALNKGLKFEVSEFPWLYGRTDEMLQRGSIEYIMKECDSRDLWITLHFPWEHKIGLNYLDEYLTKLKPAFENMVK